MRISKVAWVVALAATLTGAFALVQAQQQPEIDRDMEEAKALYRGANFPEAVLKLEGIINRMKQLRDIDARKVQLADAYLHLALSYFALDDQVTAKETLKAMLRVDPQRRLDPRIYAPPVVALFQKASEELGSERAAGQPRPAPSAATAPANKGGSKAVPIILGVAAAGGGAALLAGGGKGPSTSAVASTPAPSATPTPTPTPSVPLEDIVLVSAPPPGSTISVERAFLTSNGVLFSATFGIRYGTSGDYRLHGFLNGNRNVCLDFETGRPFYFSHTAGEVTATFIQVRWFRGPTCPSLPFDITVLEVSMYPRDDPGQPLLSRAFTVTCRLVP